MWKVKYSPGTIEAKGYKGGQQVLAAKRETSGAASKIVLRADRSRLSANGEDVAMITAEILDAEGRQVSIAGNQLTFKVTGGGKLLGLGNGDPSSHELDTAGSRRAFNGLCMAIVQTSKSADEIHVEASSPGLEPATVNLTTVSVPLRPAVA
jgi:beta-galactosidase